MGTLITIVLAALLIWAAIHLYNDIRKVPNWRVDRANPANLPIQDNGLDLGGPIDAIGNGLSGEIACQTTSEASCNAVGASIGHAVGHLGHFLHH
ncbi:hypothetical protein ACKFKG_01280 [Phormidesmis sp. 146-35]